MKTGTAWIVSMLIMGYALASPISQQKSGQVLEDRAAVDAVSGQMIDFKRSPTDADENTGNLWASATENEDEERAPM
ncbi:hypothetical protein F4775DRAFT_587371 [Biscogniauxia sp. FL1348]|nr:hypothetical protein F4775DRAFT_587371 [Biscogniauxia sp. FL1348]